jgi:hypothetical protein
MHLAAYKWKYFDKLRVLRKWVAIEEAIQPSLDY